MKYFGVGFAGVVVEVVVVVVDVVVVVVEVVGLVVEVVGLVVVGASVVVVAGVVVVVGEIVVVVVVDGGSVTASESDDGRRPFRHWTFLRQSHTLIVGWNSRPVGHWKEKTLPATHLRETSKSNIV